MDPYKVLGLSPVATQSEIKKAYRLLVKKYHPDVSDDDDNRFQEIQTAYDLLMNKGNVPLPPPSKNTNGMSDVFLGAMLGLDLRGEDINTEISLNIKEAIHGSRVEISFVDKLPCKICHGYGFDVQVGTSDCPYCSGSGTLANERGQFEDCYYCHGVGTIPNAPCQTCHGTGMVTGKKKIKIKIPPGTRREQVLRITGKGMTGERENGDLFIKIHIDTPIGFSHFHNELMIERPISIPEAVLGSSIKIKEPMGQSLQLRIPPNTSSGKIIKVNDYGYPTGHKERGPLFVKMKIKVPDDLSKRERELYMELEAIAKEREQKNK